MVKPIDHSAPPSQINGSGPPSSVHPESEDSFVVIARTDTASGVWSSNTQPSLNGGNGASNGSISNTSIMQNTNIRFPDTRNADDLQKKLEDVLKENKGLKDNIKKGPVDPHFSSQQHASMVDTHCQLLSVILAERHIKNTLQQNNLAMKQQFMTLVTWQEDVVKVQQNHKEKFEETKTLITKLKTENASLLAAIKSQPDVSKINAENEELKKKVETLETKVRQQECLSQDNADLQVQIEQLEQRLKTCITASDAQQRAERRVCELTEEKQHMMKMNDELTQRIALLQAEFNAIQANSFVVVGDESIGVQKQVTEYKPEQPVQNRIGVASSSDGLKLFCQALDTYDEKLMTSYQRLDQQMESFSHLFAWLQKMNDNLPSNPDMATMKNVLVDMSVKMREVQGNIRTHRIKLDESRQQLGRLGSEFQELLEEWIQFNKQHKDIQQNTDSYQEVQTQGFKEQIDKLTAQLLDAQEKLEHSTVHVVEQAGFATEREDHKNLEQIKKLQENINCMTNELKVTQEKLKESEVVVAKQAKTLSEQDAAIAKQIKTLSEQEAALAKQVKLLSEKEAALAKQSSADQTKELRENIDSLTAQLMSIEERLAEKDEKVVQLTTTLADRDATLAQLHVKLSQQDARLAQKETELKQSEKKLVGLEQKIDALAAQAEVYKMDFNEERESRQKIAADKERVADDLRALQRRNQQLLEQYEESQRQLVQAQQSTPTASGARPSVYNTIATPGRVRNQWPPQSTDDQVEQESTPHQPFEEEIPEPKQYFCPKCNAAFRQVEPLQYHVETCLEL